ncbi:MAG: GNAT family N-acetyltransferase [Pseudomonadota bacterium]
MSEKLHIRHMTRAEVDQLVDWAAQEGWNPGLQDAEIFWQTDPQAFLAAEVGGQLIGGGAITSYGGEFGFMGFFIVRPEHRGNGWGDTLWHQRRKRLLDRLNEGAGIGLDGVFDMQHYYAKGGFKLSHRNLRYRRQVPGRAATAPKTAPIVPLSEVPFDELQAYDRHCFPAPREVFLKHWIAQSKGLALGYYHNTMLQGYGVIRTCREGFKLGPLFADDPAIAGELFEALSAFAAGDALYLDAPENNPEAMALVQSHNMEEVFGCARMYLGRTPSVCDERIFGITTFELG